MATEVIMPKVDMVMDTGTFVEWLKREGERVSKGDPLFVISTDKAMIECEAPADGLLAGVAAEPNQVIPVSQVIAYIVGETESLPEVQPVGNGRPEGAAGSQRTGLEAGLPAAGNWGTAAQKPAAQIPAAPEVAPGKTRATPVARRLARQLGLDLAHIPGRGPHGRIHKQDVIEYTPQTTSQNAPPRAAGFIPPGRTHEAGNWDVDGGTIKESIPFSGARRIVAERMSASAFTAPHFTLSVDVDMREMARARDRLLPGIQQRTGYKLSYTALLARAVAAVLPRYPLLNSSLQGEHILVWEDVHLGIAASLDDQLIVPVIPRAQSLRLEEIVTALNDRLERARARRLTPAEMSGSTFTLSNLGMYGIDRFTAIINPPETAILAAGKIANVPAARGDELVVRLGMTLTLSIDHRVVDGAYAARFLAELQSTLETPYLMI